LTGLAVKPKRHKRQPADDGDPDTTDPGVCAGNDVTAWVLVVREVADSDRALLFDVGEEGAAVLHEEVVDTVLVGQLEGLGVEGGGGGKAKAC
jgi:hypothetical protein